MAANTISSNGTLTLSATGAGVYSTVTVTDASVNATDLIILTPTNLVEDYSGEAYSAYVVSVSAGSFDVACNRKQLSGDLTFNYISITTV
jgi:hypothetical protein